MALQVFQTVFYVE